MTWADAGSSPGAGPDRGHPPQQPPSTLPGAGPVPAALKPRGSRPLEQAPFSCPHLDPTPETQGLPTPPPSPSPGGPQSGSRTLLGWRGAWRCGAGQRLRATRSSGSSAEEASQLAVPLGRCGKGGSWAEPLAEASSPGLRAPGEVGLRGTWSWRLQGMVSGSSVADPWLGCGSLPTRFGALGLGQHCQLGGQRLTEDTECGRGSEEIRGAAGGAGRLVSLFPAALRRLKGELHTVCVCFAQGRGI